MTDVQSTAADDRRPRSSLERWGRTAWLAIGIAVAAGLTYSALASISGLVVPLVIAVVIGILAVPLVDKIAAQRVPRPVAAAIVMLAIIAVLLGSIAIAVAGVLDQGDEINRFLTAGLTTVDDWLEASDLDLGIADELVQEVKQFGIDMIPGLASWFTTVFSSVIAFLVGTFVGLFMLYYVLSDWSQLRTWLGQHLGTDEDLGTGIVDDAISTIRQGFAALTVSSAVTAALIGMTMVVLGLPLAFAVALVTFVTSYVPYLGAIFSAVFACLVALGAGETSQAFVLLIVILIAQNIVQTIIGTKLTSDRLALHPIAGLVSTIIGATLAGLLGATLSAPVLATLVRVNSRIRARQAPPSQVGH